MKKLIATLCVALLAISASAYTPNKLIVPDVEGYKTLKCDFHIHTVFSDGTVCPDTRITFEPACIVEQLQYCRLKQSFMTNLRFYNNHSLL